MNVELHTLFCKNCNASLDPETAVGNVVRCKYCGTAYILPKSLEPRVRSILDQGAHELDACRFEEAAASYAKAAELDQEEPEAYFGMALAKFRVQYLKDEVNNRIQPICHEISVKTFSADANYGKALRLATEAQKREYRQRALEIDEIRQEFSELRKSGVRYDCFLCVKVSAEDGSHTADYDRANDIYYYLRDKGYRPFFSEREIKGREGSDYEALILYALFTSECMLIVCSDEDYLQTKWVKNEYSRFYEMLSNEGKDRDAMAFAFYMRPIETLPSGKKVQGIDLSKPDAYSCIADFVQRHTPEAKKQREESQIRRVKEEEAQKKRVKEQEEQIAQLRRMLEDAERQRKEDAERRAREAEEARVREQAAQTEKERARRLRAEAARKEELDALKAQLEEVKRANEKRAEPTVEHPENLTPSQLLAMMRQAEEDEKKRKEEEERERRRKEDERRRKEKEEEERRRYQAQFKIVNGVLESYSWDWFTKDVVIPEGVTAIGDRAFEKQNNLTSVTIPEGVVSIGNYAFSECGNLTSVTIPEGVVSIGEYAFHKCEGLKRVAIPASVKTIGRNAFFRSEGLTRVDVTGLDAWYQIDFANLNANPLYYAHHLFVNGRELTKLNLREGITEIKRAVFCGCNLKGELKIPHSVVTIGDSAFEGCSGLTGALTIPEGVTSVGESAFSHCSGFTSLTLPGSIKEIKFGTFGSCNGLTSVVIPESITSIGASAFCACSALADVTIGNHVTEIAYYAFGGCPSLKTLKLPDSVERVGDPFFDEKNLTYLEVPRKLVGTRAEDSYPQKLDKFDRMKYVKARPSFACVIRDEQKPRKKPASATLGKAGEARVKTETAQEPVAAGKKKTAAEKKERNDGSCLTFHKGDTAIEGKNFINNKGTFTELKVDAENPFYYSKGNCVIARFDRKLVLGCNASVVPSEVKKLGEACFQGCKGLKEVYLPDGVEEIGDNAFRDCPSLSSVSVPQSVKRIGPCAFSGAGIAELTVPEGITLICGCTFKGSKLKRIVLPSSVAEIGGDAFSSCEDLTYVRLPDGMRSILSGAFDYCTSLAEIKLPAELVKLGDWAFRNCTALKSVRIPNNLQTLGDGAFSHCDALAQVTIPKRFAGFMKSKLKLYFGDRWKQIDYIFTD